VSQVLLLIGTALLVGTSLNLGISPGEALRSASILAFAILPWGALTTAGFARGLLHPSERVLLSGIAGYPLACALYYLLSLSGVSGAFLPLSALALAVFVWRDRSARRPVDSPSLSGVTAPSPLLLVLVPLVLLVLTRDSRAFLEVGDTLVFNHSTDHSYHLSLYWELLRGMPAQEVAAVAGLPYPTYHFLAFMPGVLLAKSAGIPPAVFYFGIGPLLRLTLLMGGIYLAIRVRTGDRNAAAASLPAVFLLDFAFETRFLDRFVIGPTPHFDLLRNEAQGGGLVVWAAMFCLLALYDRARSATEPDHAREANQILFMAALICGLSYAFKSHLFLLFGGAFGLALLGLAIRDRTFVPVRAGLVALLSFAVVFFASRLPGAFASVDFRPGLFADLYIYPFLKRDPLAFVRGPLLVFLQTFPGGLGFVLAVPLAMARVVAFSPFVAFYLADRIRRVRTLGFLDLVGFCSFLVALPMGWALSLGSTYFRSDPFEFRQAAHGLSFLGVGISVVVLHELLRRVTPNPGGMTLATVLMASLLVAPSLAAAPPYVPARAAIRLDRDELCALRFLAEKTSPDAVVMSARTDPVTSGRGLRFNHQAVVAGFVGRRSVLEYYQTGIDPNHDREGDIRRLFSTTNGSAAGRILRRYRVDYVLESAELPLRFPKDHLTTVFERGRFRIYRTSPGVGRPHASSTPPEMFRRIPDLVCRAAGSPSGN
jgi:hypothetical protein